MATTPIYALPSPDLGTTADGPAAISALAQATESVIARTRGWYTRRTVSVDSTPSGWADLATITISDALAGSYLVTSILYWWAGTQQREPIYTWHEIQADGVGLITGVHGSQMSGEIDQPACAVFQAFHVKASGGGSMTIKSRFGFSVQGVRAYPNSSLSVVRVNDA